MDNYEKLMNDKYFVLKCINSHCFEKNDELLMMETLDDIVQETKITKRTLCRIIKELENDGFVYRSKKVHQKYCISQTGKTIIDKLAAIFIDEKNV